MVNRMTGNMKVIAEAIDYLVAHYDEQPSLDNLAARSGYEPTYFHKLFKEKVGISPKRLVQYMHMRSAREFLLEGYSTMEAAYAAGLSSQSRLHDLFVSCEGVSPGAVSNRGAGLLIKYGIIPSVLGQVILAKTDRGVCWLGFMMDESEAYCVERITMHFPRAILARDDAAIAPEAAQLMRIWQGAGHQGERLKLDLYGTNLQLQVWKALLQIPLGGSVSYKTIAEQIGKPKASRAVGNAVGANPISLLIPCHRVIRATGIIDNYGWGSPRKKVLLALEAAQSGAMRELELSGE